MKGDVKMKFENLEKLGIQEIKNKFEKHKKLIEEKEEGLKIVMGWHNKNYKKNPKQKLLKFLEKKEQQEIRELQEHLEEISKIKNFYDFVITIEWKKNRTWGATCKAHTNDGYVSKVISGCGYDKLSTATAKALNSNPAILKKLYEFKENYLKKKSLKDYKDNNTIFGYGLKYGVLPRFNEGVGITCHEKIINKIGLKWKDLVNEKFVDVFLITKGGKK